MRHRIFAVMLGITVLTATTVWTQSPQGRGRYKAEEIVCKMLPGFPIGNVNTAYGTTVKQHQIQTDCYLLRVPLGQDPESLAAVISLDPEVEYCLANYFLSTPEGLQRSSPFLDLQVIVKVDSQLAALSLDLPASYTLSTGTDVPVALIDGGVDFAHPEFDGNGTLQSRFDYVDGDSLAMDEPGGIGYGHGTFIAGLIRLVAPDCNLKVYRVLDTSGAGDGYSIASAVLQAADDGCRVINLSLGMPGVHEGLDDALRLARQQGVVIVAAAGNDSTNLESIFPFPAERSYAIAVAAVDSQLLKASFSNYGQKVDLCAPGVWVYGPYPQDRYAWWDGTSFSAPFISGLVAAMLARDPSLSWERIDTLLRANAMNIDSLNPDYVGFLGAGQIQPVATLQQTLPIMMGDITNDRSVDVADLTLLLDYLFISMSEPGPGLQADTDCDGVIDVADLTWLIGVLFLERNFPCSYP